MHADTTQRRQPCNASPDRRRSSLEKASECSIVEHDTAKSNTNNTDTRRTRVILGE